MNGLAKWVRERKIHFFALAAWAVLFGVFFYIDGRDTGLSDIGLFSLGALLGGLCMILAAFQCQDVDRREGRYFDNPPFKDEE